MATYTMNPINENIHHHPSSIQDNISFQIDNSNHRPIQISFNINNGTHLTVSFRISRSSDHRSSTIEVNIRDSNEQQTVIREPDQLVAAAATTTTTTTTTGTQDGNGNHHNNILEEVDAINWNDILANIPSSSSNEGMILDSFLTPKTISSTDNNDEDNFY